MSGTPNLDALLHDLLSGNAEPQTRDYIVQEFKRRARLDADCWREVRRIVVINRLLGAANRAVVIAKLLDAANGAT
jgi:hypothetical protein